MAVVRLLDTCRSHYPREYPLVLCLARTGIRIGEAAGLQWGDLDFVQRLAEIRRAINDGRASTPKSGKGRRVDLSVRLTDTLQAHLARAKKETLRTGRQAVPEWVFANEAGHAFDPDNFRSRIWPKLLAKAGLRKIRIHDLRHTYASLLIAQGESLAYIKEQMGHHSIKVTVDTYGHLVPGGNRAAVDRLNEPVTASIRNPDATCWTVAELAAC